MYIGQCGAEGKGRMRDQIFNVDPPMPSYAPGRKRYPAMTAQCERQAKHNFAADKIGPSLLNIYVAAHGQLRFSVAYSDSIAYSVKAMYIESVGIDIDVMAIVDATGQLLEMIVGLLYGYSSQYLHSLFLRRIPFAVAGSFAAATGVHMFAKPFHDKSVRSKDGTPALDACEAAINNCTLLLECVMAQKSHSTQKDMPSSEASSSYEHVSGMYVFLSEACRRAFGTRLVIISMDSFGIEVIAKASSSSYTVLLGYLSMFHYAGTLFGAVASAMAAIRYPSNLTMQAREIATPAEFSFPSAGLLLISAAVLQMRASSSSTVKSTVSVEEDFVPALVSLGQRLPFVQIIFIELAVKTSNAWHLSNVLLYMKYKLKADNSMLAQVLYGLTVSLSALVLSSFVARLMENYHRERILSLSLFLSGTSFVLMCFRSPDALTLCAIAVVLGLVECCMAVVLPAMFATVTHYDELHSGQNRAGLMVTVRSAVEQQVLISVSMVPGLLLKAAGYLRNGGCSCGCGKACSHSFVIWDCPGDVGYVCLPDSQTTELVGPARNAGCTVGQSVLVHKCITFVVFGFPATIMLFAGVVASSFRLRGSCERAVHDAIAQRQKGRTVHDPLTGELLCERPQCNRATRVAASHFSRGELQGGVAYLRSLLVKRSALSFLILATALLFGARGQRSFMVAFPFVTLSCLLLCFDIRRLFEVMAHHTLVRIHVNFEKFHALRGRGTTCLLSHQSSRI